MNAGVVKSKYKKSEIDNAIKQYRETVLPAIATHEGARTAMLLLDRNTGDALSIAIYENEAAAKSFAPKAEQLIGTFEKFLAGEKPKREVYEVAISTPIESKAVIEKGDAAFNAHDLEGVARLTAPDADFTASGDIKLKGPQAIKEYYKGWITAFPDARAETKATFVQGKHVITEGVFVGTHNGTLKTPMGDVPATGRKVRGDYVQIFEVDRGLVKRSSLMFDQVQLMTQLGMAPAPPQQAVKPGR